MTDFHRSLDRALTNVAPPLGEEAGTTGAGGSFLPPGPHLATAPDAPHTRQDGTAGGGSSSPATHLAPGALPGVLALVALVVGVLAFGWWAL